MTSEPRTPNRSRDASRSPARPEPSSKHFPGRSSPPWTLEDAAQTGPGARGDKHASRAREWPRSSRGPEEVGEEDLSAPATAKSGTTSAPAARGDAGRSRRTREGARRSPEPGLQGSVSSRPATDKTPGLPVRRSRSWPDTSRTGAAGVGAGPASPGPGARGRGRGARGADASERAERENQARRA